MPSVRQVPSSETLLLKFSVVKKMKFGKLFPYLHLDGIVLKRTRAGDVRNVSILVSIGMAEDRCRQVLVGAGEDNEDYVGWGGFL